MTLKEVDNLVIIPKPDYISWESITDLLHLAYKERMEQGLKYGACTQTVEETIQRVGDGICFVALIGDKLVGTATMTIFEKRGKKNGYFIQNGVHPDYKRCGIGSRLRDERIRLATLNQFEAVYCDTSEKAKNVINWYLKAGWQKVSYLSYEGTNYYSVKFRSAISGRRYSKIEAQIRFFILYCLCKIIKKENGSFTAIGIIAKRIFGRRSI